VLAKVEKAEKTHETAVKKARKTEQEALTFLASTETSVAELEGRRTQLLADLKDAPSGEELDTLDSGLVTALEVLVSAKSDLAERTEEHEKTVERLADLADSSRQMSRQLTAAQLSVADLDPPVSESDDPLVQWKELGLWRDEMIQTLIGKRDDLQTEVEQAETAAAARRDHLIEKLRSGGLEGVEPFAVEVATSLHESRRLVETHQRTVAEAAKLGSESEEARTSAVVAGALANHLKATGFERWLMAGALIDLVAGANQLLGDLSEGGYSLHADDDGDFLIVDHRNADEKRSVSTLSGGETFLVSLALALSLAETLAAKGGAGLEAIILDEGFGTLDDESLDTVASVLEELTGKGLMVGVITHVKELAMRAPVRYAVRRGVSGARIEVTS
jgi:exonuclease SbcC